MCICVYVYMCVCVYVYMYVYVCICMYMYVYVYMCICVYVYMCVCVYIYILFIHMCVKCVCVHGNIQKPPVTGIIAAVFIETIDASRRMFSIKMPNLWAGHPASGLVLEIENPWVYHPTIH